MAYKFTKLSEVPSLEEVPDGANAIIEVDGEIKRVPGDGLGGGATIPTAIIRIDASSLMGDNEVSPSSINLASGVMPLATDTRTTTIYTGTCDNMTYDEAKAILQAGNPLDARIIAVMESGGEYLSITATAQETGFYIIESQPKDASGGSIATEILGLLWNSALTQHSDVTLFWVPDNTLTSDYYAAVNPNPKSPS